MIINQLLYNIRQFSKIMEIYSTINDLCINRSHFPLRNQHYWIKNPNQEHSILNRAQFQVNRTQQQLLLNKVKQKPEKNKQIYSQSNVKLKVQYQNPQLLFQWDFSKVKTDPHTSFTRHFLIIDLEKLNKNIVINPNIQQKQGQNIKIKKIIQRFYKAVPLGDFIKVYNINGSHDIGWMQRTALSLQDFKLKQRKTQQISKENLIQRIEKCLRKAKNFDESCTINIMATNKSDLKKSLFDKILKKKESYKFHFFTNIFLFCDENDIQQQLKKLIQKYEQHIDFYFCPSALEMKQQFNNLIYNLSKVRVKKAEIKLTCLSGDIYLTQKKQKNTKNNLKQRLYKNNIWVLKKGILSKKFSGLNNYTRYIQSLQITSFFNINEKIEFEVQFNYQLITNQKYMMNHSFEVILTNTGKTTDCIRKQNYKIKKFPLKIYSIGEKDHGLHRSINHERIFLEKKLYKVNEQREGKL